MSNRTIDISSFLPDSRQRRCPAVRQGADAQDVGLAGEGRGGRHRRGDGERQREHAGTLVDLVTYPAGSAVA